MTEGRDATHRRLRKDRGTFARDTAHRLPRLSPARRGYGQGIERVLIHWQWLLHRQVRCRCRRRGPVLRFRHPQGAEGRPLCKPPPELRTGAGAQANPLPVHPLLRPHGPEARDPRLRQRKSSRSLPRLACSDTENSPSKRLAAGVCCLGAGCLGVCRASSCTTRNFNRH